MSFGGGFDETVDLAVPVLVVSQVTSDARRPLNGQASWLR